MKELTIIRHAKSSWAEPGLSDHDRPLNKRGLQNSPEMGQRLRQKATRFDLIVSSHALRARQTAQLIAGAIDYPADQIRIEQNLYLASSSEILAVARSLPNQHSRIVLVGHNNGITDLANVFSPEYIANVPTCGILTMRFDMEEWNHLDPAFLDSFSFDYPKNNYS